MIIEKKDILWTYLAKFLTLAVNLILLPMVLKYLNDVELGLWYVFASISQIVNLFDFGFNATISRHMTYAWSGAQKLEPENMDNYDNSKERNVYLISQIVMTCRVIYFAISLLAALVMLTIGTIYIQKVAGANITSQIMSAWYIYSFAVFINLLFGYWSSLLQGIGAVAEKNSMSVIAKFIQIIVALVLLKARQGLLGFVISYAISGIVLGSLGRSYFRKKTHSILVKTHISFINLRECFSAIWATAWKDGLVMISQYLSTQANTLICAYFVDLGATSIYGILNQVGSIIGSLATSYYSAYQPLYGSMCLKHEDENLKSLTCRCDFIYKLIYIGIFAGFLMLGIPLLRWIRPTVKVDITLSIIICLFYYLYNQHSMFCSMIAASNRIPYFIAFIITSIGSVLLSIFCTSVLHWNAWGLVLPQLFANMLYNNWYWPRLILIEQKIRYYDILKIGFDYVVNTVSNLYDTKRSR